MQLWKGTFYTFTAYVSLRIDLREVEQLFFLKKFFIVQCTLTLDVLQWRVRTLLNLILIDT